MYVASQLVPKLITQNSKYLKKNASRVHGIIIKYIAGLCQKVNLVSYHCTTCTSTTEKTTYYREKGNVMHALRKTNLPTSSQGTSIHAWVHPRIIFLLKTVDTISYRPSSRHILYRLEWNISLGFARTWQASSTFRLWPADEMHLL